MCGVLLGPRCQTDVSREAAAKRSACSVLVFLLLLYAVNVLLKSCNISRAPSNDRNLITGKFAEVIHSALV